MAKTDVTRRKIFDLFSSHLKFVMGKGYIPDMKLGYDNTYICPLCLEQFSENDLKDTSPNRLTAEDAPPDSLGGKKIALTCQKCNNTCGHEIDFHLQERLLEMDSDNLLPNSSRQGKTTVGGETVNSQLRVTEEGEMQVFFTPKNNHPEHFDKYFNKVIRDELVNFNPKASRVDTDKLQIALLKSAYILMFAKFGYTLIFNKSFERIRRQIKNPGQMEYPYKFWTDEPFPREFEGVHFIYSKGFESIFVIFPLITKSAIRMFGVILPLPDVPIEKIINYLGEQEAGFQIGVDPMNGCDFLFNEEGIENMLKWIDKVKN